MQLDLIPTINVKSGVLLILQECCPSFDWAYLDFWHVYFNHNKLRQKVRDLTVFFSKFKNSFKKFIILFTILRYVISHEMLLKHYKKYLPVKFLVSGYCNTKSSLLLLKYSSSAPLEISVIISTKNKIIGFTKIILFVYQLLNISKLGIKINISKNLRVSSQSTTSIRNNWQWCKCNNCNDNKYNVYFDNLKK